MAKLFWLQPDSSIIEFPLKGEQNLIGRTSRCDVRIKHPGISAEHALIRVLPGSATVEDLGSTNGTRVNGKRIELHTLRHGDQIGVGRERLMYFAELDEAAKFIQPESIEPFALPAAGGETVNTTANDAVMIDSVASPPKPAEPHPVVTKPPASAKLETPRVPGLDLDPSLLAALPKGASLANPSITPKGKAAVVIATSASVAPKPIATAASPMPATATQPATGVRSLSASVAVLSGTAAGKRYPLNQPSVTLGKEGKQVIEFLRVSPTRWQIKQLEGVTPAYINGDALEGVRDLAAGDVIELTGVRLRFEITLNR
jgi:predicted component of type VI protein secretion system